MITRFVWDKQDIKIRKNAGIPDRLKRIIKGAPSSSMLKGKYYLDQLNEGRLSQKELNFILDRGL